MPDEDDVAMSPRYGSPAPLRVDREGCGSAVVVRFTGEIDTTSAGSVREALTAALAEATGLNPVVLDLTGVGFLGSSGLAELVSAHQRAVDQHTPLRIVATERSILRPLEVTGMTAMLDIHADITTALAPPHHPPADQQTH
jgi:anti-sigma B factor antagonist